MTGVTPQFHVVITMNGIGKGNSSSRLNSEPCIELLILCRSRDVLRFRFTFTRGQCPALTDLLGTWKEKKNWDIGDREA